MQIRFKTRYRFWHILLVMVSFAAFYFVMTIITNHFGSKEVAAPEIPTRERPDNIFRSIHIFIYMAFFFYVTMNYYYNLVADHKKWFHFLKISGILILVAMAYHTILYYYFPEILQGEYPSLRRMYRTLIGSMIPMLLVTFIFAYITYLWESQKQRTILEAQKLQLETQISQANFNFLKAQINPHFLHNTLNFLYSKSLAYSSELSEGILTLSDIMRYALNQGNQKDGKAPLKDEIEHVNNVIKISQLRYGNRLNVIFDVTGNVNGEMIIPFVLITIVENAFKHGDLKNPEHPIEIKLNVTGGKLYFYCRNKKQKGSKEISTGIGLPNIKKRLDLAYGDQYKYIVNDEAEFYTTELTIEKL